MPVTPFTSARARCDSVMHADARPLAPFSDCNALLGWLSWDALHLVCVVSGAVGVLVLVARRVVER